MPRVSSLILFRCMSICAPKRRSAGLEINRGTSLVRQWVASFLLYGALFPAECGSSLFFCSGFVLPRKNDSAAALSIQRAFFG